MSFEEAREYLARVVPWPQGGEEAYINIHYTLHNNKYPRPVWRGSPCRTVSEAVNAIAYAQRQPDVRDIYACMSSQSKVELKTSSKTGKAFNAAARSQENAVALKSIFIDIDVRPGQPDKGYETLEDATAALGSFVQATGLPQPSVIVESGGGLQPYWVLSQPLAANDWRPLAFALAEATKRHGLKCDTQCTIDAARVLRVPDTENCKREPRRPVRLAGARTDFDYSVDRLWKSLEAYRVVVPTRATVPTSVLEGFPQLAPLAGISDLAAGVDTRGQLVDLLTVAPECGFVRDALATGGMNISNPLWNISTLLATFCEDGRAQAHAMGNQHPDYTKESTDELYDRKERERQEKNLGWPLCTTISGTGCTACSSCQHLAAGKSPLNHRVTPAVGQTGNAPTAASNQPTQQPGVANSPGAVNDLPPGYSRDAAGFIFRSETDDQGVTVQKLLCKYAMKDPWMQRSPWILHFQTNLTGGRDEQITVPFEEAHAPDTLRKCLWSQGITFGQEAKAIGEFMTSWIQKLQATKGLVVDSAPFGWIEKAGKLEGFCYGDHVWTPVGDRPAAASDHVLAKQYRPVGDLQPWVDAANLVTSQGRSDLDAVVASAFGAPLVRFTGMTGLLMSIYSMESGIGKSTALKVAQSVWGNPITAMQGLSDTSNSVINKIGEIKSLPLYWDELKTEDDTRRFVNLAFQLSLGKEKSRLRADASQRDPGTWQTIMVSASNESLLDFVLSRTKMTTAGLFRVFEYVIMKPTASAASDIGLAKAQGILSQLHGNYGNVGLEYAKFLGLNFTRVKTEVETFFDDVYKECNGMPDERFWFALVACICMGAKYANELGFTALNEAALKKFMIGSLTGMRRERKAQHVDMDKTLNVSNILAQFLGAMRARHTLFTNRIHVGAGKPKKDSINAVPQNMFDIQKLEDIRVQRGVDDKLLRISSVALSNWCKDTEYSRHMLTKALEREFGIRSVDGVLGSGTKYATGVKEHLLEIDLTASTNASLFLDGA
jgi:Domain of unknown function (DUF927)